jgi:hypothetical protein
MGTRQNLEIMTLARSMYVPQRDTLQGMYLPSISLLRCKILVRLAGLNEFDQRNVVFEVTPPRSKFSSGGGGVSCITDKYNRISALQEDFSQGKDTPSMRTNDEYE